MTAIENTSQYSKLVTNVLKFIWGITLLSLCSQIQIPLEPVPITLQTVGVMLVGILFDRTTSYKIVLSYITLGICGIPVFAGYSSGLPLATAGYLVGFVAAVLVMGYAKNQLEAGFKGTFINCMLGTFTIFVFGVSWLAYLTGFKNALTTGLMPFIIPGLVKSVILAATLKYLRGFKKIS